MKGEALKSWYAQHPELFVADVYHHTELDNNFPKLIGFCRALEVSMNLIPAPVQNGAEVRRLPRLTLIAALARNNVIGVGNRLPWHLPEDLRHFRACTRGHPVIMGRRTWESLPDAFRPLPERPNFVLSRDPAYSAPGATQVASLEAALARLAGLPEAFVIGGARLYAQALPRAERLCLTEIDLEIPGDVFFPVFSRSLWRETRRGETQVSETGLPFAFVTYERAP
ncbi:MAG: dihydrofolate reductase [Zoogloeaceae bacterium]|jgi:dihydrofolate reductase|nr:dihydrofolate reductase [Zoogloeaceae bacterium]